MKNNNISNRSMLKVIAGIALLLVTVLGNAQIRNGKNNGINSRQQNRELFKMEGTIQKIENVPNNRKVGRFLEGTHLMVKTQGRLIAVHLGPTAEVSQLFSAKVGDPISMILFQVDQLLKDDYTAKEVSVNGKTTVFRDDLLRPVWSGNKGIRKWKNRK